MAPEPTDTPRGEDIPVRGPKGLPSRVAGVSPAAVLQQPDRRLDLRWTGANLRAMLFLCLLCAGGLAVSAAWARFELGERPAVDTRRSQAAADLVNPNAASGASLRRLPELGPACIGAILDYRRDHGPAAFKDPNDLMRVRGIGHATLQAFRDYLEFGAAR